MRKKTTQGSNASTVKLVVPSKLGPDRRVLVQAPDGRTISAVVPKGCSPGQTILIQVPLPKQQQQQQQPLQRVQIIRVPESKRKKGEKFNVRLPDGRTIVATVPYNGCREFSLDTSTLSKQQRQQNWHDNPLAVAPMVFGPML